MVTPGPGPAEAADRAHGYRGSSAGSRYSRLIGPNAVICVTYSPDLAQWKWGVPPGRTITAPGGYARSFPSSNCSPTTARRADGGNAGNGSQLMSSGRTAPKTA